MISFRKHRESKLFKKYFKIWNNLVPLMQQDQENDQLEFVNDININFKWTYLLMQEIEMCIRLCCGDTVKYSNVSTDEFDFIVERRGFTPRMEKRLKQILIKIGIGKELK